MLSAIFDKVDVIEFSLRSLLESLTVVTLGIGRDIRQFPDARDFALTEGAVQNIGNLKSYTSACSLNI